MSMLSTETVWNRRAATGDIVDARTYNLTIGAVLLWGFFLNYWMVQLVPVEVVQGIPPLLFLIGYVVCVIAGTSVYQGSDDPVVSFLGYNLLVVPLGLILVGMLPMYPSAVIAEAFLATGAITTLMMFLAAGNPKFFLSIGRGLMVALICAVVVEFGFFIFTGRSPSILNWAMIAIFSGYIGYDWARAQSLPKTLDNAVDCAAALYVDIVILFMRLLRAFSRR
ncbi:MAG: Bax inhibitor-1 family protein [Myxococcota bacterium]|nr:Bax inhibitor-1 family protein [Myxococcota bacterium]